jgi:hypothetical protein
MRRKERSGMLLAWLSIGEDGVIVMGQALNKRGGFGKLQRTGNLRGTMNSHHARFTIAKVISGEES